MKKLKIPIPTIFIIGLNRSGTTALAHSLLNNRKTEVYKDPGKFKYESKGIIDFNHFFNKPISNEIKARVIKQSIGQYTVDLCTIPLYPTFKKKPDFIKQILSIFLIRNPANIWNSWQSMTYWLRNCEHQYIKKKNIERSLDHGIGVGWGEFSLFRLAFLYFYETFKYVNKIAPDDSLVLALEDLQDPTINKSILSQICNRIGLEFSSEMINWTFSFGKENPRLIDGIRRNINDMERQFIHKNLINSRSLGKVKSDKYISKEEIKEIENGELGVIYREMYNLSRKQLHNN